MGRAFRRGGLVAVLASAMLALGAGGASAVIIHLGSGKPVSYQPLRGVAPSSVAPLVSANLIYHGGPVMTSNTNYTFYWAPRGSPAYPAGYQSGVNRYLEDLAHDSGGKQNVDSVATQYNDGERRIRQLRIALRAARSSTPTRIHKWLQSGGDLPH